MKADVILGLQWGDEGKGKIVDFLAPDYEIIARFQGGPNAGHTLEFEGNKHVLHQIPSGIFRDHSKNIVGNGVVLDPVIFKKELEGLAPYGVDLKKSLYISKRAQLILPSHRLLDACYEQAKGAQKIGSTLKGIGPTYQDKIARLGLRVGDIILPDFNSRYKKLVEQHESILKSYGFEYDLEEVEKPFFEALEFFKTLNLVDTEFLINESLKINKKVLAEGAQGSLLDVDFGSYPFVTSSNTTTPGVCTGLGIAPARIGKVYGIFKAYCTRVGSGPFPTELEDEVGELLRKEGNEFGSTTGRPRRCGWLDLPALKYAIMINGVTDLIMMKVDVLNVFKEISVCTQYELEDGTQTDKMPFDLCQETVKPILKTFKGWEQSLEKCEDFQDFPNELKDYIYYLESELEVPIRIISAGPDRKQTIFRPNQK